MTPQRARFNDRHLSGEALCGSSADEILSEAYDYVLMGSSWDERSIALTNSKLRAGVIQVLRPSNRGHSGRRAEHDAAIESWATQASTEVDFIDGDSEDVESAFQAIQDRVLALRKELNRPINVLVDLSATVRYLTLGLVALALNDGVGEVVDVFYAEALYEGSPSDRPTEEESEHGTWDALAVPGLEGDWYPGRARHFLVSAGFHAERAARLAERWDPNRVSVLLPRPALTPEYEQRTFDANVPWMNRFDVAEEDSVEGPPTDAISTWRKLASAPILSPERENIYCLLCGSKPHALALTVWALARQTPAALYVKPTTHREQSVQLTGTVWVYRLWDRTLLSHSTAPA